MKYLLITFHKHEYHGGKVVWRVYGHTAPSINDSLGEYETDVEAMQASFRYGVPVMLGLFGRTEQVLRMLAAANSEL